MKIQFDVEEFKKWLEDLYNSEYKDCSKWDYINDWYVLKDTGELVWMQKWYNSRESIEEETEVALKGEFVEER